jgi:Flp pilus assembly protein TadG
VNFSRIEAQRANKQVKAASQQGSVLVMAAVGILFILGMVGLAVDLGHLYVVQSELRRAADGGAMAGVRSLFPYPLSSATLPMTPNCAAALNQGRSIALANLVDGNVPTVANLQTGSWDWSVSQFKAGCGTSPFTNAVTITLQRDQIEMTVMGALGFGPVSLQATSTAVMDWVGKVDPGTAFVMMIGKKYVQTGVMNILLNPAPLDAGGWYAKVPANANNSMITGYLNDPSTIPGLKTGDMVNLNNGDFGDVEHLLKSSWIGKTVWVPVVDTEKFNQSGPVVGFTSVTILDVGTLGGNKYVKVRANPMQNVPDANASPGGANLGLLSIPRVVQ